MQQVATWCDTCNEEGSYSVEDPKSTRRLVCESCGTAKGTAFCVACGAGYTFPTLGLQNGDSSECPTCGEKTSLPDSFFTSPIIHRTELRRSVREPGSSIRGWKKPILFAVGVGAIVYLYYTIFGVIWIKS